MAVPVPSFSEQLRACGVVGAGGAGFPAAIKAEAHAEFVLANGAECEPLLHKDAEIMKHHAGGIVEGMRLLMQATGASRGKFGIKTKNAESIEAIRPHLRDDIDWVPLGDFYPSGDEYELVYAATGRLIPPAGIPLQVGCVVNNVETMYNVWLAAQGKPVTRKFVSIAGAVSEPKSFWVPVGVSFREVLELCGGPTVPAYGIFVSGLMMGTLTFDDTDVVTKTTAGLIVLPRDHYLVRRKATPVEAMHRIGKSACDQCSYCTEFCPRYLLGYQVLPHKVMRSLGFTSTGADLWNQAAELCCACGLCTLYACPEDLFPKEACDQSKADMRKAGIQFVQTDPVRVHPMKEGRRVPLSMLRRRLKVEQYERETPFSEPVFQPGRVRLKMSQHAGKPAVPVVREKQKVRTGDVVGEAAGRVSARIHASMDGVVRLVSSEAVEIEA